MKKSLIVGVYMVSSILMTNVYAGSSLDCKNLVGNWQGNLPYLDSVSLQISTTDNSSEELATIAYDPGASTRIQIKELIGSCKDDGHNVEMSFAAVHNLTHFKIKLNDSGSMIVTGTFDTTLYPVEAGGTLRRF